MKEREFDLNIEKILENWEVHHAIREIISNALDEQAITNTEPIQIVKKNNNWHIIDFGRGLNYHHLTQNENEEKLKNEKLIGRFGVGLKDALATLYRHNIKVTITSKFGIITLIQNSKIGFEDIITLHAKISAPKDINMIGTDFCLEGCSDYDVEKAESLFLHFSNNNVLETTNYGQIIEKTSNISNIYINGIKVAEESNFLFSYNITSLTSQIKKALNRERTNIGRSAYTNRVKDILKSCNEEIVIKAMTEDLQEFSSGNRHDELSWNEVAMYVSRKINAIDSNTTFVTADDLEDNPSLIDEMKRDGFNPIVVPETLATKMNDYNEKAKDGETLNTAQQYVVNMQQTFSPEIIDVDELSPSELKVFCEMDNILNIIGGKPTQVKEIQIAESLYQSSLYRTNAVGLWEAYKGRILIQRDQLRSICSFAGTLLHECIHAISGTDDVTRDFEIELTHLIGLISEKNIMLKKRLLNSQ